MMKNDAGVLLSSFLLQIRANRTNNFSIPLFQMLRFSRRVSYYDTVYRRICFSFLTEAKEMDEVSFVETSSVLDETDISMNFYIGGADGGGDADGLDLEIKLLVTFQF